MCLCVCVGSSPCFSSVSRRHRCWKGPSRSIHPVHMVQSWHCTKDNSYVEATTQTEVDVARHWSNHAAITRDERIRKKKKNRKIASDLYGRLVWERRGDLHCPLPAQRRRQRHGRSDAYDAFNGDKVRRSIEDALHATSKPTPKTDFRDE